MVFPRAGRDLQLFDQNIHPGRQRTRESRCPVWFYPAIPKITYEMISEILKPILTASGCSLVIYEQDTLVNLYTDQSDQFDTVGIIIEPNTVTMEVVANAIHDHFNPLTIEILMQVRLEDKAEQNDAKLKETYAVLKRVINRIINTALFKTQKPYIAYKIRERKYDANVIGWGIGLNLFYLNNATRDPCL
jgi:hypothetical protein